ncbi:MAG: MFS transporter [Planctomycetota bacterium]
MRKHILTGAMGAVYFTLLSGIFLVAFGNIIGLQHWQWALLSSASSFVLLLQLASAYIVSRIGSRKALWFIAAMASRLLRGSAIAVAFLLSRSMPGAGRLALLSMLVLANCFDAICAPPWLSWLADIIPKQEHGHFMGRRSGWIALANLLIIVPAGFLLDRAAEDQKLATLVLIFGFGFLIGVLDLLIHRTIPEPLMDPPPRSRFWKEVAAPFRNRQFRPWLIFNGAWTFSMTLGGSLAAVHFVENLGIRRNFLGGTIVLITLPLLGSILTARNLGTMVDRHGVKRMLKVSHRFWAVLPLFWLLATPNTALWWLGVAALIGGISSTTAHTAASKLITRLPPAGHVPMYVAASTCVGCVAGGFGPLLAGLILHLCEHLSVGIGPFTFIGFHVLFAASLLLRNAATLLIPGLSEPAD